MFPLSSEFWKISISLGNLLCFPWGLVRDIEGKRMGTEQDQSSAQIDLQFYYLYYYYFDNVNILDIDRALWLYLKDLC